MKHWWSTWWPSCAYLTARASYSVMVAESESTGKYRAGGEYVVLVSMAVNYNSCCNDSWNQCDLGSRHRRNHA
jgi:hypothetical protein